MEENTPMAAPKVKASIPAELLRRLEPRLNFRSYIILRQALSYGLESMEMPQGLTIREALAADLEQAIKRPELGISGDFLTTAQKHGARCFAAFDKQEMVAYTWRTSSMAPHEYVGVSIASPYVYAFKGWTLPSHKGLRLNAIVNRKANEVYRNEGFTHFLTFTSPYNQASLNAMKPEYGYERIGYAAYGMILGKYWSLYTPKVQATSFRFGPPRKP